MSVNVRPNEELLRKLAGQLIGQLRDAVRFEEHSEGSGI